MQEQEQHPALLLLHKDPHPSSFPLMQFSRKILSDLWTLIWDLESWAVAAICQGCWLLWGSWAFLAPSLGTATPPRLAGNAGSPLGASIPHPEGLWGEILAVGSTSFGKNITYKVGCNSSKGLFVCCHLSGEQRVAFCALPTPAAARSHCSKSSAPSLSSGGLLFLLHGRKTLCFVS